jgi:DNA-binding transcriptional MerR regulator
VIASSGIGDGSQEAAMARQDTVFGDSIGESDQVGYSGTKAASIVGISYRQLDYWARTDLIRPSLSDAMGSGSRRRYSYGDLLELKVIKTLLDAGIRLETVRTVFEYLREHVKTDIASAHLVINGSSVVLCDGDQLIDVVNRGQGVLNVLSLSAIKADVDTLVGRDGAGRPADCGLAI